MDRPLRIWIDARELEGKRTGVGRYLINLLSEWSEIAPQNVYTLLFKRNIPDDQLLKRGCFSNRLLKLPGLLDRNIIWEQAYLPLYLRNEKYDLFFSPSYTLPLLIKEKAIVTIHDISYEVNPEWFPSREAWIRRIFTRYSIRKAKAIITISEFSKRDIIRLYGINDKKVKVIYLAPDRAFSTETDSNSLKNIKERYNTGERFILYVGSILNRRPIETLLKAFSKVIAEEKRLRLVIVGENRTSPRKDIVGLINSLGIKDSLIHLNYVPDDELALLYKAAQIFIYPSFYEGFGLPVVEAMASGTPVIVPNLASFPEIVGDCGVLIDKIDEEEMAKRIINLSNDESQRRYLARKGKEKAGGFSWNKSAGKHLELFYEIMT
jgi:glycosyltransferase involved in cell wall biosynthesis